MRVLVLGALGFIGRQIVAALVADGHEVLAGVRAERVGALPPGVKAVAVDLQRDLDPAAWLPRLVGVEAIVNAAGALKGSAALLDAVHRQAPLALARAAAELGLQRLVQISALGDPADGAFIASKHAGDAALLECALPVTVLRPSLVYALAGSYGGSSLLRALAAVPGLLPLPGRGRQLVQPVHARDLATLVVAALQAPPAQRGIWTVVGPERMSIADYLKALRRWLGYAPAWPLPVPPALLRMAGALGEGGDGPLGRTLVRMVARGNAGTLEDHARLQQEFGLAPAPLAHWMAREPSQVQDRWHARLYPLAPTLRIALGLLCLLSAVAGFAQNPAQIRALAAPLGWPDALAWTLGYGGSALDALLGAMLLCQWQARRAALALLALVTAYTVVLGSGLPLLWLDPWGGLAKNLVVLPAILVWLVLADRR